MRNKLQSVNEISLCKSYFQSLTITSLVDESGDCNFGPCHGYIYHVLCNKIILFAFNGQQVSYWASITFSHLYNVAGLDSEGIYRISGFADDVEALKNSFDKGNTSYKICL